MKEHPILFSGPLIRAIREGRKTVTRRLVTARHVDDIHAWEFHRIQDGYADGDVRAVFVDPDEGEPIGVRCPFGAVGDGLWTRETWGEGGMIKPGDRVSYAADWQDAETIRKWRPSIHMPRWASRDNLVVTDIGVERLQDITEEDALAEGMRPLRETGEEVRGNYGRDGDQSARAAFALLWEGINGNGSWASNPYVWRIAFRRAT